jgi:hypothetical protein
MADFLAWCQKLNDKLQTMGTLLLLIGSALICFTIFYKAIEWFERI